MRENTGFFTNNGTMIQEGDILVFKTHRTELCEQQRDWVLHSVARYLPLVVRYSSVMGMYICKIAGQEHKPYRHDLKSLTSECGVSYPEQSSHVYMRFNILERMFSGYDVNVNQRIEELHQESKRVTEENKKFEESLKAARMQVLMEKKELSLLQKLRKIFS